MKTRDPDSGLPSIVNHPPEEGRENRMKHLTLLLAKRRPPSSSYDPQPGDVPVTVLTALILLLILCFVALL